MNRRPPTRIVLLCFAALSLTLHARQSATQAPVRTASIRVDYNVMVPMRDGTRLSTDIYRPSTDGRFPAVLVRDPYRNGSDEQSVAQGRVWASRGYVFIRQDVRGRNDSEGRYYPYVFEGADGYDVHQWIGAQPWSDGKIGMLGASYLAATQWTSTPFRSSYLKAIMPMFAPFNYYRDVFYVGGAFSLASRASWGAGMAGRTAQTPPHDWAIELQHLPLITLYETLGLNSSFWRDWIVHSTYDAYWRPLGDESQFPEIDVPALSVGGWFDVLQRGTLTSYSGMVAHGRAAAARASQKLVMGPWRHGAVATTKTGDLEFGPDAKLDTESLETRWLDYWLKGIDNGIMREPPVRLFVMGDNHWRSENEWPLARTRYTKYYLHSDGHASSSSGTGTLDTRAPTAEPADTFTYDPRTPVPTKGGNLLGGAGPAGPLDQREIERRPDVLVFTSEPLADDVEVTGSVTMELYASSSARDTDFTAKLVDLYPDGAAYNIVDGIIRARYRESATDPTLIEPGKVYRYPIDLWATSNVFKKSHRIRLEISSSNFPRFDRNPNTGHPFGMDAELASATQTVHHSAANASNVVLPIVPKSAAGSARK